MGRESAIKEKVLKGLDCCRISMDEEEPFAKCSVCPYNDVSICVQDCRSVLCADAIAVLIDHEAIKPKHYEATRYNGELFACGDCKHELEQKPMFCPYCGKAVKWE